MRDKQQRKNPTNADRIRKETTELKRYKKYITPYLSAFVIGPLMMLTEVAGEVMLPKFMSMIINNGVASRNVAYIGKMGTLMVLPVLFMAVGGILGAYFSAKASISFTSDMRNDLFRKVQQFSFENIDDYSTGSLVTRLTNDILLYSWPRFNLFPAKYAIIEKITSRRSLWNLLSLRICAALKEP